MSCNSNPNGRPSTSLADGKEVFSPQNSTLPWARPSKWILAR